MNIEKEALELLNKYMNVPDNLEQTVPQELEARLNRTFKQNIKLLSSEMTGYRKSHTFQVKGSTGQVYAVDIGPRLRCSCRDHMTRATHCKHILYVLYKELNIVDLKSSVYESLYLSNQELQDVFSAYHQ